MLAHQLSQLGHLVASPEWSHAGGEGTCMTSRVDCLGFPALQQILLTLSVGVPQPCQHAASKGSLTEPASTVSGRSLLLAAQRLAAAASPAEEPLTSSAEAGPFNAAEAGRSASAAESADAPGRLVLLGSASVCEVPQACKSPVRLYAEQKRNHSVPCATHAANLAATA